MDVKIKIKPKTILFVLAIIPFMDIIGLWYLTGKIRYLYGIVSVGILSFYLIRKYKTIRITPFVWCFLGYEAAVILTTLIKGNLTFGILYSIYVIWIMIQLVYYEPEKMLESMFWICVVVILLNFASMFLFSETAIITESTPYLQRYAGILGGRNSLCASIIPMVTIICVKEYMQKKQMTAISKVILLAGLLSIMKGKSSTGIVVALIVGVLYIYYPKVMKDFKNVLLGFVFAEIVLVFFNTVLTKSEVFLWIVEKLHRDAGLSMRPVIWTSVVDYIKKNLFWGYGRGIAFNVEIYNGSIWSFEEAHNTFLQIAYQSGIIGLLFYIAMIFFATYKLWKIKGKLSSILEIGILGFLVGGLMESIQDKMLFFVLLALADVLSRRGDLNEEKNIIYDSHNEFGRYRNGFIGDAEEY